MILVTGATGTTGSQVVRQLAAKGVKVRALVHNPAKAQSIAGANVEIVSGDLGRPESLAPALTGVEKAYLVSSASPDQVALHRNFIAAAKQAGVKHVVRHSGLGADPNSPVALARWHAASQQELETSGLAWTHVQPHFFMQNFLGFAPTIKSDGAFYAPMQDAAISMVDARDIAAVAVAALTGRGHEGKSYIVTGPRAVSYTEAAQAIGRAIGKPVKYVNVAPEDALKALLGMGMPEWFASDLLGLYAFFSTGQAAFVTDTVASVTGTPGHDFAQFASDYAAVFSG